MVADVEGKVRCREAEGDVGQELVVSGAGKIVRKDQCPERLEGRGGGDDEGGAEEDRVGAAQVFVGCHGSLATIRWQLVKDDDPKRKDSIKADDLHRAVRTASPAPSSCPVCPVCPAGAAAPGPGKETTPRPVPSGRRSSQNKRGQRSWQGVSRVMYRCR